MGKPSIHPLWLRLIHWFNAAAIIILIMSGWQIYNATGFMGFRIPKTITLGGWLGGAIQWHFAAIWVLFATALLYAVIGLLTRRIPRKFFPVTPRAFVHDLLEAARGKLAHEDLSIYNTVQRVAYLAAMLDVVVLIISGLVLWKSVQFPYLRVLVGGYEGARRVHFFAMSFMVAFIFVHVVMALLVPKTIKAMLWGR
ncbi:cytochrome b/b6 domain-containing protein [Asticcacaulis sp. EMRT-3]|uniref:cytochrome b/b6 domain-containing protein n=1 Tax=Asticcacaulis sp. EMRT-3 TaxID=3040349 RepID=UPI0024AECE34|nr:cytochrome b/b6 domain-containing protein [Asticcacaulis sp. EMRT-3]MDI7776200.1 cytochrome b/b6 domain-containing protein [Asticcacaulis sp. EMRT-3]